jgi:sugar lactone lactonase YvrE
VWKIAADGKLSSCEGGGHWLALDENDAFAGADLNKWFRQRVTPNFGRLAPAEFGRSLLVTDGQPFVVNRDGNLYYAKGNLEVARLTPQGKVSTVVAGMAAEADKLGGIKGLACGPDGSIYVSYPRAVQRITPDGRASMVIRDIDAQGCTAEVDPARPAPDLRGLAVDRQGIVYIAATNCRRVLKITPTGKMMTVMQSPPPWTPTGVAVSASNVYVLEFSDANDPRRWRPRVLKLAADGKAIVLATISR